MFIVCQVNRETNQHYEETKREFEEEISALRFLFESFSNMYGNVSEDPKIDFWDPVLKEQSSILFSVEMFPPNEDEGWYLVRDWKRLH